MTVEIQRVDHLLRNAGLILPEWVRAELGGALALPTEADLVTQSVTQLYPIGTQLRMDGKLFRYCKAGETMALGHQGFLKCTRSLRPGAGVGCEATIYSNAAVGDTEIYIGDTADRVKDYYEDALLIVQNDTLGYLDKYRIIGSELATSLDYVKVKIAPPGLKHAQTTSDAPVYAYRSPWIDVRSLLTAGNQSWFSAAGMAGFAPITSGYFFWLQTAGPCWGTGASTWPGEVAYQRTVMANTDGSLIGLAAGTVYYQKVGYLLAGTAASGGGDVYLMLELDR